MKYDDASWHYGGNFPTDLPPEAGMTHIAIFVVWAILNGVAGEIHNPGELEVDLKIKERSITPTEWFISACDEKFTDEDLSEEGNSFAQSYYADGTGLLAQSGSYLADYQQAFPGLKQLYEVPPTWASYDRVAPLISKRFKEWRARKAPRSWFKFWER